MTTVKDTPATGSYSGQRNKWDVNTNVSQAALLKKIQAMTELYLNRSIKAPPTEEELGTVKELGLFELHTHHTIHTFSVYRSERVTFMSEDGDIVYVGDTYDEMPIGGRDWFCVTCNIELTAPEQWDWE